MKNRLIMIGITFAHFTLEILVNSFNLVWFILWLPVFIFNNTIFVKFLNTVRIPGLKGENQNVKETNQKA